jgi:hypothetical protein
MFELYRVTRPKRAFIGITADEGLGRFLEIMFVATHKYDHNL